MASSPPDVARVVVLGASNLTRGLQTVVSAARATWGPAVEVLGALGHGRSYGATSRFAFRRLPGILDSGLWRQLDRLPPAHTRALITDVGNDILYGSSADQTLEWVSQAVDRLARFTNDILLTDLPLASIRGLSRARFLLFRSLLVPECRLSLEHVLQTAERVNEGLAALAARRNLQFFRLRSEWYGFDPIHFRPSVWQPAWREILCTGTAEARADGASWLEALRLYLRPPERLWLFGVERVTPQSGAVLPSGGRLWLY